MPTTFLKYAGNKKAVMNQISSRFCDWSNVKRYIEPFAGALGSAVSLTVPDNVKIVLSDCNWELVHFYNTVLLDPARVESIANSWACDAATYYEIRSWDRDPEWKKKRNAFEIAARTIYLNRRGFNGLYRVSEKTGHFNVAWGKCATFKKIEIVNNESSLSLLRRSKGVTCCDWRGQVDSAGAGDLLYCDPPYADSKNPTRKQFTGYLRGFCWEEQVLLENSMRRAAKRGAFVVATNAWCDETLDLYRDWDITRIFGDRKLSALSSSRGKKSEMLATLSTSTTQQRVTATDDVVVTERASDRSKTLRCPEL